MELLYSLVIAVLSGCGLYLVLQARTFSVVMGLTLFSYAVNLFLIGMGRLRVGQPAIISEGAQYADPVPQALVLTAIVIGFAMTAFLVVLALKAKGVTNDDHVDGVNEQEPSH